MPEDVLSPDIDIIVVGEGVFTFRELVKRFENGKSLAGIPGTMFVNGSVAVKTDRNSELDLDAFPLPARDLTSKYRRQYYSEWMKPLASLRTSKGCPYRCNFCAEWKIAGGKYYKREPIRIVEELATIAEECVFFTDDESLIDPGRMSSLAKLIKEAGIKKRYSLYGRSDTIARHPELLEEWRAIGLERVFIGLEFFRDKDLSSSRKGSCVEDNATAVHILQRLGIDIYASFIVRPDFSRTDFTAFRDYCRQIKLNYASFAVMTPLPGTDLYEEFASKLLTRNYDYNDFIHTLLPTTLPLKEFYAEYRRLYMTAIPLRRQLALLPTFPLREIPGTIRAGRQFYDRLKTIHLDYAT